MLGACSPALAKVRRLFAVHGSDDDIGVADTLSRVPAFHWCTMVAGNLERGKSEFKDTVVDPVLVVAESFANLRVRLDVHTWRGRDLNNISRVSGANMVTHVWHVAKQHSSAIAGTIANVVRLPQRAKDHGVELDLGRDAALVEPKVQGEKEAIAPKISLRQREHDCGTLTCKCYHNVPPACCTCGLVDESVLLALFNVELALWVPGMASGEQRVANKCAAPLEWITGNKVVGVLDSFEHLGDGIRLEL